MLRKKGTIFGIIACLPAIWHLAMQVYVWIARARYPFDIEWLEGAGLYQAYRTAHGLVTYGPPTTGYLPLMHPLGYPALLAFTGRIFGLDYATGRTLSFAFFVLAVALTIREIRREAEETPLTGWVAAILAAGCAAASSSLCLGFFDMIRDDSMALSLTVVATCLAIGTDRRLPLRRVIVLAALLTALVYTRLTTVFFVAWIMLFVLVRHAKTGLRLALWTGTMAGLVLVSLQLVTKGWYWIYTVGLYQHHHLEAPRFIGGLRAVWSFAPFIVAIPVAATVLSATRRMSARAALWVGLFTVSIPASLLPFSKVGGFENDFLPIGFFIGPAAAFLALDAIRALEKRPRAALATRVLLPTLSAAFLIWRAVTFHALIPTADQQRQAEKINSRIARLEGGVIIPVSPFLPAKNGDKTWQLSDMSYLDVQWSGLSGFDAAAYIDRVGAKYAIASGHEVHSIATAIAARYRLEEHLAGPDQLIGDVCPLRYLLRTHDDESSGHVVFDFEGPLIYWKRSGAAFAATPDLANPPDGPRVECAAGEHIATSLHPKLGEAAMGLLVSPPFKIDRPRISMRIGGGRTKRTRAELLLDNRAVRTASPVFEDRNVLTTIVWDVRAFYGHEVRISLVDESSDDHIACDQIVLY